MKSRLLLAACLLLAAGLAGAQDWKMAPGPLKTRWADEVGPNNALPEYPRPTMKRAEWLNLNGLWDYAIVSREAEPQGWDGKILVPFAVESALSGVGRSVLPFETLWYHRTFTVPADWTGQRVLLHFGAVDWATKVWVNGTQVAEHEGGYNAFSADITAQVRPGQAAEITLSVSDPTSEGPQPRGKQTLRPGGIFYTPTTGIWQTVWLEPVAQRSVESLRLTPDTANDRVVVRAEANVERIVATAYDGDRAVGTVTGAPGSDLSLVVSNPKLWSPQRPFLYRLIVQGYVGNQMTDRVDSYFGLRSVRLGRDAKGVQRPLINGEFIFQVGFLDQGYWPDGILTAPTDEALRWDIEKTLELGFNMARKHVKVEPERWYYWADKLGLLVWQDQVSPFATDGDAPRIYERELRAMLRQFHNHPSIVMWVVFNEGWGQHDTPRYVDLVRSLDNSRLINNASGWTDTGGGDVIDIHVYPGPDSPDPEPTRAAVLGEFGGLGLALSGHTWAAEGWGYRTSATRAKLTDDYIKLLRRCYQLKDEKGLSAIVYTQTTDVEVEINGLITYDRAIVKPDPVAIAKANRGIFPPPVVEYPIVPTSENVKQTWRYTTSEPGDGWIGAEFNDTGWSQGPGGFGVASTPGAIVGTVWNTENIWLRREFTVPAGTTWSKPYIRVHHDEDVEVYLNGTRIYTAEGFVGEYDIHALDASVTGLLRPGRNVLAVHCRQTRGGQFVDVGLVDAR